MKDYSGIKWTPSSVGKAGQGWSGTGWMPGQAGTLQLELQAKDQVSGIGSVSSQKAYSGVKWTPDSSSSPTRHDWSGLNWSPGSADSIRLSSQANRKNYSGIKWSPKSSSASKKGWSGASWSPGASGSFSPTLYTEIPASLFAPTDEGTSAAPFHPVPLKGQYKKDGYTGIKWSKASDYRGIKWSPSASKKSSSGWSGRGWSPVEPQSFPSTTPFTTADSSTVMTPSSASSTVFSLPKIVKKDYSGIQWSPSAGAASRGWSGSVWSPNMNGSGQMRTEVSADVPTSNKMQGISDRKDYTGIKWSKSSSNRPNERWSGSSWSPTVQSIGGRDEASRQDRADLTPTSNLPGRVVTLQSASSDKAMKNYSVVKWSPSAASAAKKGWSGVAWSPGEPGSLPLTSVHVDDRILATSLHTPLVANPGKMEGYTGIKWTKTWNLSKVRQKWTGSGWEPYVAVSIGPTRESAVSFPHANGKVVKSNSDPSFSFTYSTKASPSSRKNYSYTQWSPKSNSKAHGWSGVTWVPPAQMTNR